MTLPRYKAEVKDTGKTYPVVMIDYQNNLVKLRIKKADECGSGLETFNFREVIFRKDIFYGIFNNKK